MTAWAEMESLVQRWIYASLVSVIVIAVALCVFPLIPTTEMWSLHRYIVMGCCRVAFGTIVLPGAVIVFDLITPGGSFIARIVDSQYGPVILCAAVVVAVALIACWV